jgi:hypothetical protein
VIGAVSSESASRTGEVAVEEGAPTTHVTGAARASEGRLAPPGGAVSYDGAAAAQPA